jgi:carboxyl-terminal processing protease
MRLVFCWFVALWFVPALWSAEKVANAELQKQNLTLLDTRPVSLVEGPNDANIAKITARLLQHTHYLKRPVDDAVASEFLDRYLESLDNLHIYFTQADLEEFKPLRTKLDDLTFRDGDTAPARTIFRRFRERIDQQYEFAFDALKTRKFEFTGDERYVINRRELPRPKDLDEAKELWWQRLRYEYLQEKLNKTEPDEVVRIIQRRYTRLVRSMREYDNDDVFQLYLTALAHAYDPHSDYFGAPELENFSIGMKLSLFGIGALLRSEDGYCKIQSLVVGGPAERSKKLKPNDKIIAVAQGESEPVDVVDMKLRKVVDLIRGQQGSEVRLTVIPADAEDPSARKVVTLVREEIKLEDQAAKAKLIELPCEEGQTMRVGVIDLPSFYATFDLEGDQAGTERKSTTSDVAKLLRKLMDEKVDGVVLDLRRNGGGSLEEAINLTGLFIKEGTVVRVKDSNGNIFDEKDTDPAILYDGPLVVLTSRFSASASEILAGALQDYQRAVIVGDSSTHGKGTVQSLIQLKPIMRSHGLEDEPDPGALKITIRKFYRPSGESTQLRGVIPDLVLPSVNNHADVGESSLTNPLEWDTIKPADYKPMGLVAQYLPELRKRSEARRATSPDFAYIQDDIERYKKAVSDKTVLMNEATRLKEKAEADERAKARKKELVARPAPPGVVYEIGLHEAAEPGLPKPGLKPNPAKQVAAEKPKSGTEDGDEDEDPVIPDTIMQEAQRILVDYVNLSSKDRALAHVGGQ